MNIENTKYLLDSFPEFYPPHFYFECGDGWFELVKNMSLELKAAGYNEEIHTVKEKFGMLRVYADDVFTDQQEDIVGVYEARSAHTCEECGKEGKPSAGSRGWIKTLCEEHTKERA